MQKGWLAVFGILMVVGLGGLFLLWRSLQVPVYTPLAPQPSGQSVVGNAADDSDPFDITITYTNDGYSPRDITIAQGTRVRFLNAASETTWPASGVHPTHTLYPEKESTDCLGSSFDSCRGLKPEEFYDFTFYYPGRWPFHDHEHAFHSGSITVTASSTRAQQ